MENVEALIAELETEYKISESATKFFKEQEAMKHAHGSGLGFQNLMRHLRKEVYDLLCQNPSKYHKEKNALKHSVAPAVGVLSSSLASRCGMEVGVVSGFVALALLIPLKLSLNAWCGTMKR